MEIEELYIKNFRAVGENPVLIKFDKKNIVVVGENNVGKTTIIKAVELLLNPDKETIVDDRHNHNENLDIAIELKCKLSPDEVVSIFDKYNNFSSDIIEELINCFSSVIFCYESSYGHYIKFGDFYLRFGNVGQIDLGNPKSPGIGFSQIVALRLRNKNASISNLLKQESESHRIIFDKNPSLASYLNNLLKEKILIFSEFRERPNGRILYSGTPAHSSTGRELASILFNLKNSRISKGKMQYYDIKNKFENLFPGCTLDVIEEDGQKLLSITKNGVEITTEFIGSGYLQMINFITSLVYHKHKLFMIDEPELNLHPHAQRLLSEIISESDNKFLIITHSPYFINLKSDTKIVRAIQESGALKLYHPSENFFKKNLTKLREIFNSQDREIFFARKVILVEGPTEVGALPVFFQELGNISLDEEGISLICVDGFTNFRKYIALLREYHIPCFVLADKNTKDYINKLINKNKDHYQFSYYILSVNDFNDLFDKTIIDKANEIFGYSKNKVKPAKGKFMAEESIKLNIIPDEIRHIVSTVSGWVGK